MSSDNDAGGTNWKKFFEEMAQIAMMNNPGAIVTDVFGNVVKPLKNYHPHIRGWYKRKLKHGQ